MKDRLKFLEGSYSFEEGKFVPQGDMESIESKVRSMKMLAGSTETGAGEFYYDELSKSHWHYIQFEDYRTVLREIARSEIESKYPEVNCDKLLDVGE